MKIYEIDTGCLNARKGATVIKMVSVESVINLLETTLRFHKRYGNMTNETEMRFNDMLKEVRL